LRQRNFACEFRFEPPFPAGERFGGAAVAETRALRLPQFSADQASSLEIGLRVDDQLDPGFIDQLLW
jgi:hypothetical protein